MVHAQNTSRHTHSTHPRRYIQASLFLSYIYIYIYIPTYLPTGQLATIHIYMLYTQNHNDINNNSTYRYAKTQTDSVVQLRMHLFIISVGRDPKNPTTSSTVKNQLSTSTQWQRTQFSVYMVQCQPSTAVIFKILKFSAHLFWT